MPGRALLPTAGLTNPHTTITCLPISPCSASSDGKPLPLSPGSAPHREGPVYSRQIWVRTLPTPDAQVEGVSVLMLERQGKEEAQMGV